jgi:hypothetical protein
MPGLIRALAQLPFRQVWTTFPGILIEVGMREHLPAGWPSPQVVTWKEAAALNPRRRTLLKILGDFRSYVVTPTSVRRALSSATDLRNHARGVYNCGTACGCRVPLRRPISRVARPGVRPVRCNAPATRDRLQVGPVTVVELMAGHHRGHQPGGKGADDVMITSLIDYLDSLQAACGGQAQPGPDPAGRRRPG